MNVFNFLQTIILVMLALATLYIFVFSVAGLFYHQRKWAVPATLRKIAVMIPGYKEDEVIVNVAQSALLQEYPKELFDIIIIADSFRQHTLEALRKLPVKLIEVSFDKSTKSKALNRAMAELSDTYELAVVLDADNLMAKDFLYKINAAFESGCMAVQGHRTAKNTNNSWAILDAISEEINNNIFRKGHRVLGLSSAIIGSGMAFQYHYFKQLMLTVTAVGGFDKEIELKMLKEKHTILYLDDAIVYDEKIQHAEVFGNQRRRWLSAQIHYFRKDIVPAFIHLITKGNVDYFDKAIQFIQPPRILLLGSVVIFGTVFSALNYLTGNGYAFNTAWATVAIGCLLSFLFAVPGSFYTTSTISAMVSLPKGMLLMLWSLMKIKGANKKFIHTKHTA